MARWGLDEALYWEVLFLGYVLLVVYYIFFAARRLALTV
jgi:hypothetical protein